LSSYLANGLPPKRTLLEDCLLSGCPVTADDHHFFVSSIEQARSNTRALLQRGFVEPS
jgi:hypothetical protein